MTMLIELDHTSSGAQICAALVKDAEFAGLVNLQAASKKSDLYMAVVKSANAKFADLGSDIKLDRHDVKKAVIAAIYGGTHQTASASLTEATGLAQKDAPELHSAFWLAIKEVMSPVMLVEKYVGKLVKAVAEVSETFELPLASGGTVLFRPQTADAPVKASELHQVDPFTGQVKYQKLNLDDTTELQAKLQVKAITAAYVQSFDAYILANVQDKLAEAGVYFLAKHDAYLVAPEYEEFLKQTVSAVMADMFAGKPLDDLRAALESKYQIDLPQFEDYGSFDANVILGAKFLIA